MHSKYSIVVDQKDQPRMTFASKTKANAIKFAVVFSAEIVRNARQRCPAKFEVRKNYDDASYGVIVSYTALSNGKVVKA